MGQARNVASNLADVGEQLRNKASGVGQQLHDVGGQLGEAASEHYGKLRDTASNYYEQGREQASAFEQNLEDYVRERPVKAILVAAGIGVLLGVFLRR